MDILIKKACIVDPNSKLNGKQTDIYISKGKIEQTGRNLEAGRAKVIDIKGLHVSPGWLDIGVQTGDPGLEHREDIKTVTKAAAAGGFTAIACYPNTLPVMDSKSGIFYLQQNSKGMVVDCLPIGAMSEGCEGKDITEMIDMQKAGACAFSDGKKSIQHAGLLLRALMYVKAFDGLVMNHPHDKTLAGNGQINEGQVSTMLGMRGIPSIAEDIIVQRDIELAAYAESRLHISNISTASAVTKIRKAKTLGIKVTASVAAINLLLDDTALSDFDSNLKVLPPLRSKEDITALKVGLKDGTIDFITSNHVPLEEEVKKLEFPYAEFGSIGLETAFSVAYTALKDELSLVEIIAKFSTAPRAILNVTSAKIEKEELANMTLFLPEMEWEVSATNIFSRSRNTPFIGTKLQGKVLGIINGKKSDLFNI
jgi:dihydroorotase